MNDAGSRAGSSPEPLRAAALGGGVRRYRSWLTRGRPLGVDVDRVQRLAGGHEQPVPLGAAEADIPADLRDPDAPGELPFGRPDGHAAVADGAAGVARAPEVPVDVAAH